MQARNASGMERGVLTFLFETPEDASKWDRILKRHIDDYTKWGKAAEEEMEILTPSPSRHNFNVPRRTRFASLYEETPLAGKFLIQS